MSRFILLYIGAFALLLPSIAMATPSFVEPNVGIAGTEAVVGSQTNALLTVQDSLGTPGTTVPDYSPKAFSDPIHSSVNATSSIVGDRFSTSSTGLASADLATGQLKVGAGAALQNFVGQDYLVGTGSLARLSDVLTLQGDIPSPITVRLSMTVRGSIESSGLGAYPNPNDTNSDIQNFFLGDPASGYAEVFIGDLLDGTLQYADQSRNPGHLIIDSTDPHFIQLTLFDDYTISATNRTIAFLAIAGAQPITPASYGSVISDFEHTADLAIALPKGLSFTSQSGVFLSEPQSGPTSVPEPASFVLLLCLSFGLVILRPVSNSG